MAGQHAQLIHQESNQASRDGMFSSSIPSLTVWRINSRKSGETLTAQQRGQVAGDAGGEIERLHQHLPVISMPCSTPAGTQTARLGGTTQSP